MTSEGLVKIIFTHVHPEFSKTNEKDSKTKTELKIIIPQNIRDYLIENKRKAIDNPLRTNHATIATSATITTKDTAVCAVVMIFFCDSV